MMNRAKTLMLLAALTALLLFIGQAIGGRGGLLIALVFASAMNLGAWWFSDSIVLRMHGAKELTPAEAPELHRMVAGLAQRAGLPMPRLYMLPEDAPNAFATGRSPAKGAVAVTAGLTRVLDRDEVAAVIAHELGHIKHRDTLIMSVAAMLAGSLSMLANSAMWGMMLGGGRSDDEDGHPAAGLLGILIAPIAASLIQMAISRSREFLADEAAAQYTGDPRALARALRKIHAVSQAVPFDSATPATAHLYIANPFTAGGIAKLFSTHPPMEERVARLEAMAGKRLVTA
jgi:heat shock protein HtpX